MSPVLVVDLEAGLGHEPLEVLVVAEELEDFEVAVDQGGHGAGGLVVAFDIVPELLLGLLLVEDGVVLDGLLHHVLVEGPVSDLVALQTGDSEQLKGLGLRGGGEGEVAGVGQHLFGRHEPQDPVLRRFIFLRLTGLAKGDVQGCRGLAPLAAVGLVDDDREGETPVVVADLINDEGKLLDGGNDDLLAVSDVALEGAAVGRVPDHRVHLSETFDRVPDLLVQYLPVRDHDDGLEHGPLSSASKA